MSATFLKLCKVLYFTDSTPFWNWASLWIPLKSSHSYMEKGRQKSFPQWSERHPRPHSYDFFLKDNNQSTQPGFLRMEKKHMIVLLMSAAFPCLPLCLFPGVVHDFQPRKDFSWKSLKILLWNPFFHRELVLWDNTKKQKAVWAPQSTEYSPAWAHIPMDDRDQKKKTDKRLSYSN